MKRFPILVVAYLIVGAFVAAVWYWLTGIDPYGYADVIDISTYFDRRPQLTILPDVLKGFLISRFLAAVLVAALLSWCSTRIRSATLLVAVGVVVPLLYEVIDARPYADRWVGMTIAVLKTWPSVPVYMMPARLVLLTAGAYIVPAVTAGLALSIWALKWRAPDPVKSSSP